MAQSTQHDVKHLLDIALSIYNDGVSRTEVRRLLKSVLRAIQMTSDRDINAIDVGGHLLDSVDCALEGVIDNCKSRAYL